jgi:hypothetical protein
LEELLTRYGVFFAMNSDDYRGTDRVYHRINTGEAQPIRQTLRKFPVAKQVDVDEIFDDMHQRGVIEKSEGPMSFPVVLVWKKNGDVRLCVDYRNDVTKIGCFPLPRFDDTLDTLPEATTVLHCKT